MRTSAPHIKSVRFIVLAIIISQVVLASCTGASMRTATPARTPADSIPTLSADQTSELTAARRDMVLDLRSQGINDEAVLRTMEIVPRHFFVPSELMSDAYLHRPLPIGYGQTISSPYIVAWMTEVLQLQHGDKVLEVGTGSGYQAAILSEMGMRVYTLEIIEPLAVQAEARLQQMGYRNITVLQADGYFGWPSEAPYDGILVTCASDHIPRALIDQLADGGRMVLPVGPPGSYQTLWLVEKQGDAIKTTNLGDVIFVPLTGQH